MDPVLVILLLLLSGFLGFILISAYRFIRLPRNNPILYLKHIKSSGADSPKKIVLIGDSITHGTVSANYVDLLDSILNLDSNSKIVTTINAGVNGEFTYNVLQRLGPINQCAPDLITILIGTNDAHGSLTPKRQRRKQRNWKLPELPDETTFRKYLNALVSRLKTETRATLALLSIPTIGEDPTTGEFAQSVKYSQIIKDVASATGVTYLPLNETMVDFLAAYPSHQKYPFKWYLFAIVKSILAHAVGRRWEREASANGFQLHTDHLHLSPKGVAMVADLIKNFYDKMTPTRY